MKATRELPNNFILYKEIDLSKNRALVIVLNIAGLFLYILFGWAFLKIGNIMRPDINTAELLQSSSPLLIIWILISFALVLILHEFIHGLFFWLVTGDRPKFGFRGAYAFAGAPNWYLPRIPYLVIGSAPLVVITILGIALIIYVPAGVLFPLLFALVTNAAGSLGDVLVIGWLITVRKTILICDAGEAVSVYYRPNT
jgi:hypothetical protein